uniref:Uncharacterized protein n=1 Tax=Cacopsylla melanoneura TaxID=428564 RepID=A0A8D8Z166_9HEMI
MAVSVFRCSLKINFFVCLVLLINFSQCRANDKFDSDDQIRKSAVENNRQEKSLFAENNDYFFGGDFKLVKNIFSDCLHEDFSLCLKLKAVNVLNRALVKDDLDIIDGVRLKRTADVDITQFNPVEVESARNMDSDQKEKQVDQILQKQVSTLFQSRSIESEDSIPDEGKIFIFLVGVVIAYLQLPNGFGGFS